jgi:E3 ubiquitin-protein ligase HUWE1
VSSLFASTDPDIVVAALQTLAAFVKKPVQSNRAMRWHGDAALNARLFSLSQGWGGKEEGLGLLACAMDNGCDIDACKLGAALHFEFYAEGDASDSSSNSDRNISGLQVIHIPELHMQTEGDLEFLQQLVERYKVPPRLRFSLLTRLRFARAFPHLSSRRQYICIRLLAFTVLLQSNPDHEDLTTFFINEPEFLDELVTILQCEDTVPEEIRLFAVLALAAQSQDRPRQSNVLTVISAGGHRGILPSLMQKAIGSITESALGYSIPFVEALLSLVTVLVSSSTGCAALREAGLIPTLIPLLKDMDPEHTRLVSAAVHILEAFMDYSNSAGTLFRDLGGLDDTVARLKLEVAHVEVGSQLHGAEAHVATKGKALVVEEDMELQQASAGGPSDSLIPYPKRLLLKALLRAIALGTYAPGTRLHGSEESSLPACLCVIFRHAKEFGGGVFSLAASVMSDLIHKDPTCFSALDAAGLPSAFLDAITSGVLPSSEAVGCIPNSLDALCLNNSGLQAVRERNALGCFVKIFTTKTYVRALANDTPGSLASGLDELMRHAPSLRGAGIDVCIEILRTIAIIGGAAVEPATAAIIPEPATADAPVPMDTDAEDINAGLDAEVTTGKPTDHHVSDPGADGATPNTEAFLSECINNVVRLLETVLQNADTSRIFIEKKGIEALLQLYSLPHLPISFGGSSTAHNMSVMFRAFSPQHSVALTRAVCGGLTDHLKVTLIQLNKVGGKKFSDLESMLWSKVAHSLSATECYISLSAVLVRSSSSMITELSTTTSEVLKNIGKVQQEVAWQISMLDDGKVDMKKETDGVTSSTTASVGVGSGSRQGEDDADAYPVVRYVNPVQLRSNPSSHWGVEPDYLPILHGGDGSLRRARRDQAATTEALTQMAQMGRLARHTENVQLDLEPVASVAEPSTATEPAKQKSPELLIYEMMNRLMVAARGLYVALGKAMVVPSRRRDDTVPLSVTAKSLAGTLSKLLRDNLSFDGNVVLSQSEPSVSVKCRYLGKVVEDISAVLFDGRRRTCNTLLVNNLAGHGGIKQMLATFSATSQLLWTLPQSSGGSPMEMENVKAGQICEDKSENHSWLLETLQIYTRILEQLVTSSLLLTPTSMAQMLIQPVSGGSDDPVKDPESFVRDLQGQVLEVVLPIWNHPRFLHCNASFINSIASIITHIYTGVGNVNGSRLPGVGGGGLRLIGPPPDESSVSMIVEMGFSRARAEEALRQVDNSSVEMAMEWLFSHPEEIRQVKALDSDVLGHFSCCVLLRCCLSYANKYFLSYGLLACDCGVFYMHGVVVLYFGSKL